MSNLTLYEISNTYRDLLDRYVSKLPSFAQD